MKHLPVSYFERIYDEAEDPWGFETRHYEQRKYALSVAALPRARYVRAFEPGCSFGVLTELLAPRCETLIASELVPAVADRARSRLTKHPHVEVEVGAIPDDWPSGRFDLFVLSEVLYYLTEAGARQFLQRLDASSREDTQIVAVHYRGTTDYPMSGDDAHALLRGCSSLHAIGRYEEDSFAIEIFERCAV
jgi:hypothetical protein